MSVDQVGSKDSDHNEKDSPDQRTVVSVDQVGSKDSDPADRRRIAHRDRCPLIRLVPRTATCIFFALGSVSTCVR